MGFAPKIVGVKPCMDLDTWHLEIVGHPSREEGPLVAPRGALGIERKVFLCDYVGEFVLSFKSALT